MNFEKEYNDRMVFKTYCEDVPLYKIKDLSNLIPQKINDSVLRHTEEYIKSLSLEYTEIYRKAFRESNSLKNNFDLERLQELKRNHHNTSLEEFVTNKNEFEKIVEYEGKLIQKTDPIYLDPRSKFIKAHFYAPRKMVFGHFIPTFWVNVLVIWAMTIGLYILLYYRVLKRMLDFFENFTWKK